MFRTLNSIFFGSRDSKDTQNSHEMADRLSQLLTSLSNPKTTRDARMDIYVVITR